MKALKLSLILFIFSTSINSQTNDIKLIEDSIQTAFTKIILSKNDNEKLDFNIKIETLLSKILNKAESFQYPFIKLKHISKLNSDDDIIRVYSWNVPFNDGTFKYYGFIQIKSKNNRITLIKLNDKSDSIINAQDKILDNETWYGALYYKILTNKYKNKTYYTLLGWDGNDTFTNKKLIDVLTIKRNKIQFGSEIFKMEKKIYKRVIFEYSQQAKMMLRYDEKQEMIVFDHLSPSLKKFKGQYMYYGPDLSQDGLKFIDGKWILKQNLDLRNKKEEEKKTIKTSF